ncbi:hypothetical protein BDF19DRAFT_261336 [Syncephalis fuscata]|nr:hypothetical protein BDF19DRAFT_261336 [Syncephalis fuscata]
MDAHHEHNTSNAAARAHDNTAATTSTALTNDQTQTTRRHFNNGRDLLAVERTSSRSSSNHSRSSSFDGYTTTTSLVNIHENSTAGITNPTTTNSNNININNNNGNTARARAVTLASGLSGRTGHSSFSANNESNSYFPLRSSMPLSFAPEFHNDPFRSQQRQEEQRSLLTPLSTSVSSSSASSPIPYSEQTNRDHSSKHLINQTDDIERRGSPDSTSNSETETDTLRRPLIPGTESAKSRGDFNMNNSNNNRLSTATVSTTSRVMIGQKTDQQQHSNNVIHLKPL